MKQATMNEYGQAQMLLAPAEQLLAGEVKNGALRHGSAAQ
jgi:hypothetical protein